MVTGSLEKINTKFSLSSTVTFRGIGTLVQIDNQRRTRTSCQVACLVALICETHGISTSIENILPHQHRFAICRELAWTRNISRDDALLAWLKVAHENSGLGMR
jgi:hypothetical protein